jgi:two-component system LytT family response regulator
MIKAVLVDDEILVLNLLDKIISGRHDIRVIAKFTDPEEALVEIPLLQPDVLFLDVDMPELNGIELATRLLELVGNEDMAIVFVTAYEQYAIHAFKLNAIHYILKPVDFQSVDEVMKRIGQKREKVQPKGSCVGEIGFFGHMHLRVNGNEVDFLTAKIEELLALLIIHREKGISKWRIIDVLWEKISIEKSQQNLYTMVFRLKKKLKDSGIMAEINYKNSIYSMSLKDVHCDLIEFDHFMEQELHVSSLNVAMFEKVISLYKGDLLEEKDYAWCVNYKEKYYQQFLELVVSVAAYYATYKQQDLLNKLYHRVKPILMDEDYERIQLL